MKAYIKSASGSIYDLEGKCLFLSVQDFTEKIIKNDNCFICCLERNETNLEHVIPDWMLNEFNLTEKTITLFNKTTIKYNQYKIPCCKNCNALLGDYFEKPLSKIFKNGINGLKEYIKECGVNKIFTYMCLLFLKTHLKDNYLRLHKDLRKPDTKIGEIIEWENFHHVFTVVRSFFSGASIEKQVIGSLLIFEASTFGNFEKFDYADDIEGESIMLRMYNFVIICTLNDSSAGLQLLKPLLKRINGALSPIQARELFSRISFYNLKLKNRPRYNTNFNFLTGDNSITVQLPETGPILNDYTDEEFGEHLYKSLTNYHGEIMTPTGRESFDIIRKGKFTFILNDDGNFISNIEAPSA
ncbi:hypothetical protein AB3N62_10920 [Leptospira sp. WS4.C2]